MKWLENMVLQTKLVLLTTVILAGLIMVSVIAVNSTKDWQSDIDELGEIRVPSIVGLLKMRTGINKVIIQQNRVRGLIQDPERMKKWASSLEATVAGWEYYQAGYDIYAPLPQTPEEATEWKQYEQNSAAWKKMGDDFQKNILAPLAQGQTNLDDKAIFDDMTKFIEGSRSIRRKMLDNIEVITKINEYVADTTVKSAVKSSASAYNSTLIISSVSVIVAILLSFLFIRSITRAITQSVTTIRDGAMQITSASDQVASSSTSLAQGASQQASSVEQVSATLEQSTAINTQNTDNALQADILAKNANDSARAGYEKGEQLSQSMHSITESAAKISGIIKAIDQIAFQTNLLALNAAVEAARAGEHGLGFAVVADEVRNLAQRAAGAAKETSDIIEEVVEQIKEGNEIALATHTSFQEIVEQSKKVSNLIGEISIAGKEQSEGMSQINQAMGQVDEVTQQVAANSEEAAAAAEELNAQATSMTETVQILARMVGMNTDVHVSLPQNRGNHIAAGYETTKVESKPVKAVKHSANNNKNDAEEIFPLNEDDLKEF
jgi:methyl-accepting chemotaxis protein